MAYLDLLINSCTVKTLTYGIIPDAYGNFTKTWVDTVVDCRWSTPSNREVKVGAEVVLADLQLFLPDITITEQDRVILDGKTYEILSASKRQNGVGEHHVECMIRTVR